MIEQSVLICPICGQETKNLISHTRRRHDNSIKSRVEFEEEFLELKDAYGQNNKVLEICELCDLVGAIEAYAQKYNLTLADLIKMKEANKRAFQDGTRH